MAHYGGEATIRSILTTYGYQPKFASDQPHRLMFAAFSYWIEIQWNGSPVPYETLESPTRSQTFLSYSQIAMKISTKPHTMSSIPSIKKASTVN